MPVRTIDALLIDASLRESGVGTSCVVRGTPDVEDVLPASGAVVAQAASANARSGIAIKMPILVDTATG